MKASELLAEVRQIPGYGAETPGYEFYRQVYALINSRRGEIAQFIGDFKPYIPNVFNTIDKLVASAAEFMRRCTEDTRQGYQNVSRSNFTSTYGTLVDYLDFQIRVYTYRIDGDAKLVGKAKSIASAKKDQLVIDTLVGMAQEWEKEIQQTAEVLEQLKAFRELFGVYARAALAQHDEKLRFLLDKFEEIEAESIFF